MFWQVEWSEIPESRMVTSSIRLESAQVMVRSIILSALWVSSLIYCGVKDVSELTSNGIIWDIHKQDEITLDDDVARVGGRLLKVGGEHFKEGLWPMVGTVDLDKVEVQIAVLYSNIKMFKGWVSFGRQKYGLEWSQTPHSINLYGGNEGIAQWRPVQFSGHQRGHFQPKLMVSNSLHHRSLTVLPFWKSGWKWPSLLLY